MTYQPQPIDMPHARWWARPTNLGDLLEWGPLLVAAVVYLLGDNPALAVGLACLKFAAEDFRTAAWIHAYDHDPVRGMATAWLHRALGMSKVAFFGIVAIALTGAVFRAVHPIVLGQGMIQHLLIQAFGGLLVAMLASLTSGVLAAVGIVTAMRYRLRIWIDWRASRARRANAWPPCDPQANAPRRNLLIAVLLGDCAGIGLLAFTIGVFASSHLAAGVELSLVLILLTLTLGAVCLAMIVTLVAAIRVLPAADFDLAYLEVHGEHFDPTD